MTDLICDLLQHPKVREALAYYCSCGASSPSEGVSVEEFKKSERDLISAILAALPGDVGETPVQTAPREPSLPTSPEMERLLNSSAFVDEQVVLDYSDRLRLAQHRATRQATLAEMEQLVQALENVPLPRCEGTNEDNDTCGVTFTCQACLTAQAIRRTLAAHRERAR